jgi:RecT family
MNAQQETSIAVQSPHFDITPDLFQQFERMANMMASATVAVPDHFRGKPGNCFAIVAQAYRWRMDPYAVAQKTHVTKGGLLGYEGQLVSAVVTSLAPIRNRPTYEFIGDWSQVLGKCEKSASDRTGGQMYVATYTPEDEEGLGVIVRATFNDETVPREVTVMMSQAYPRFSTQWATDPQQQICFLAIRKWARRYTPDVLLGVYTPEERLAQETLDMGTVDEVPKPAATSRPSSRIAEARQTLKRNAPPKLADVLKAIHEAGDAVALTKAGELATKLVNDEDKESARKAYADKLHASKTPKPAAATSEPATDDHPVMTFAEVADQLNAATDKDGLDLAADTIRLVADEQQRNELGEMYSARAAQFDDQ